MDDIANRILIVIDEKCKNRADFARRIGVSDAAVYKLCNGKAVPSGSTITAICSVFGVNRTWLETGEGEPFKRDEVSARVKKSALPGAMVALVEAFEGLTEEEQLAVLRFVDDFAEKVRREQAASQPPESPQSTPEGEGDTDLPPSALDGLNPENRAMADEYIRELALEQAAAEGSSHSSAG